MTRLVWPIGPCVGISHEETRGDKLDRLFRDLFSQVEGAEYRDRLGHPLENNVAYLAAKGAVE